MFDFLNGFYLVVVVATVINMILGGMWYSPKFLGAKWLESHQFDESTLKAGALHYLGAFVNGLVMAWVYGCLLMFFGVSTILGALCFSFWIWLGFIATSQFSGVIWAKKPLTAYFIDAGFFLAALFSMGVVFGLFFWWTA